VGRGIGRGDCCRVPRGRDDALALRREGSTRDPFSWRRTEISWPVASGEKPAFQTSSSWSYMVPSSPPVAASQTRAGMGVVTGSKDKTARLWDAATGTSIALLSGHDGVWSAVFSPNGSRVVTASMDMSLRLWDAATGASIVVMRGHEGTVWSAVFLARGKRVATTSADNTARIWDISRIPEGNIFRVACSWLPNHDLTDIAHDYGLTDLKPICQGDPPMPD
jgi:WD40 repeat protein